MLLFSMVFCSDLQNPTLGPGTLLKALPIKIQVTFGAFPLDKMFFLRVLSNGSRWKLDNSNKWYGSLNVYIYIYLFIMHILYSYSYIYLEGPRKRLHFSCVKAVPFLGPLICLKVAPGTQTGKSSCLCGGHLGGLVCSAWKLSSRWIQSLCGR